MFAAIKLLFLGVSMRQPASNTPVLKAPIYAVSQNLSSNCFLDASG